MRRLTGLFLILFVMVGVNFADDAMQTDWSGGDGVDGPVTDWGNEFDTASRINWLTPPGGFTLGKSSSEHYFPYTSDHVYMADLDGDGDKDVINERSWMENGNGWASHPIDGAFDASVTPYSDDIDGDGDMDVLGATAVDDDIVWWENDTGDGTSWTKHIIDGDFNGANTVYSGDIDGDGDMDVLGFSRAGSEISWWENDTGDGTTWTKHIISGSKVLELYCGDMDGDGDIDILGTNNYIAGNKIYWWENDGSGGGWMMYTLLNGYCGGYSVTLYGVSLGDITGNGAMNVLSAGMVHTPEVPSPFYRWWSIARAASGSLSSSILDTNALPEWGQISWTADTPANTTVSVRVRASSDSGSMGSWTGVGSGDELGDYLTDYDRYFQYNVYLSTSDPSASPTFEDVTINWTDHTAVESVDLYANTKDEGVLLSWSILGDTPATVSVLRAVNENQPIVLSGELSGSATSWLDVSAEAGVEYAYYLEVTELDGTVSRFGPSEVVVPGMVSELALSDPYPNPADENLTIHYELTQNATVKLHIYDVAGRLVETLVSGEQTAGRHSVNWDSSTSATGVYLLRLEANGEAITKRAVISR